MAADIIFVRASELKMTRPMTQIFSSLTPFYHIYIPYNHYSNIGSIITHTRGYTVKVWDLIPTKLVYEIRKPFIGLPYTFILNDYEPKSLFTQMYHSGHFDGDDDKVFLKKLYKELTGLEYDAWEIINRSFEFEDDENICKREKAVDVMAKLYFCEALEGGSVYGNDVTSYKRIGR